MSMYFTATYAWVANNEWLMSYIDGLLSPFETVLVIKGYTNTEKQIEFIWMFSPLLLTLCLTQCKANL